MFTGMYWPGFSLVQLLSFKSVSESFRGKVVRFYGLTTLKILGIDLVFENPSNVESREARVNVSNHQSALDMILGAALSPEGITVVAKKEIIYVPFFNVGWWAMDFIRIDRGNSKKAIESLFQVARKITSEKRTVWILPEGTRSPPGEVRAFKKGAFHLAIQAQVPIYPSVFYGTGELLSKSDLIPKRGVIRVRYLPPVETKGMTAKDVDTLVANVQKQVAEAYEAMKSESKARSGH
jgi:1-acyl-sn-glycerol-3-phosphate acyltransferase